MSQAIQDASVACSTRPVFIARQPIFHLTRELYGFELLFRADEVNRYQGQNADASTLNVIANGLIDFGLDQLTGGHKALINFTGSLLQNDVTDLLPPATVVIEILEDVQVDNAVVNSCRRLKKAGYAMALDDFVLTDESHPLLGLADIVKVDFALTTPEQRKTIAGQLVKRGIVPLAEKVETQADFDQATADGYSHFQGYFFSKPVIQKGAILNGNKLAHVRLLEQITRPDIGYDELADTIELDVSLTFRLLRFINSAWAGLSREVTSIRHSLALLGLRQVRKWVALISLRNIGEEKPVELIVQAMTRAKMGEALASLVGMKEQADDLFLMGMFSLIDGLLDMPMADVLGRLPLGQSIKAALLDNAGPFCPIKQLIEAYERGEWRTFLQLTASLGIDDRIMPVVFRDSLTWANRAFAWHEGR